MKRSGRSSEQNSPFTVCNASYSLRTDRLLLRRFRSSDWQDVHAYLSSEEVVRFEPYGAHSEAESQEETVHRAADIRFWAIELKASAKMIGNLYLAPQASGCWELGFILNPGFQKQGYATEAAKALIAAFFEEGLSHRIEARCDPLNEDSWHLLERLGFLREAHLRRDHSFKRDVDGEDLWADTYVYGLLLSDWQRFDPLFPPVAHMRMRRFLGDASEAFLEDAAASLAVFAECWQLSELHFLDTPAVNLLYSCVSALYGACILKICLPGPEFATETDTLLSYQGRGYVKLWAYDRDTRLLLLERIFPGDQLKDLTDHRERAHRVALTIRETCRLWDGKGN